MSHHRCCCLERHYVHIPETPLIGGDSPDQSTCTYVVRYWCTCTPFSTSKPASHPNRIIFCRLSSLCRLDGQNPSKKRYTGGDDQWAPAGEGGDQYPYAEEDAYGYPSAPPPPPPPGGRQRDWDGDEGVPAGGRISSSKSKARRRGKRRGRPGGGGGGGGGSRAGDGGFDEASSAVKRIGHWE